MFSVPNEVLVAERARWLAELADALDAARRLLGTLDIADRDYGVALDLHMRIAAACLEVQSLRVSRSLQPRTEHPPNRTDLSPWRDGAVAG